MLTGPDKLFESNNTITKIIKDNVKNTITLIEQALHKKKYKINKINKNYIEMTIKDNFKLANNTYKDEIKKIIKKQYRNVGWKFVAFIFVYQYKVFSKSYIIRATFVKDDENIKECISNATNDIKNNICTGP